jgi:hypothetical protein
VGDEARASRALRTIAQWSNRANDAYAMGEAPWAGGGYLIGLASRRLAVFGTGPHGWEMAAKAVERIAKVRGIDPRRHRLHARHMDLATISSETPLMDRGVTSE